MEKSRRFDLQPQIGRGVEQQPGFLILSNRNLSLGSGLAVKSSGADPAAVRTITIPLRKAATGGRTQDFYAHELHCSANVGVDLAVQRDFLELRRSPFHVLTSSVKLGLRLPQGRRSFLNRELAAF